MSKKRKFGHFLSKTVSDSITGRQKVRQQRQDRKTKRRENREKRKNESGFRARRMAKLELKNQVKLAKVESRTAKAQARAETKQTAYEHGVDPNSWVKNVTGAVTGITGIVTGGSVLKSAMGAFGGGGSTSDNETPLANSSPAVVLQPTENKKGFFQELIDTLFGNK